MKPLLMVPVLFAALVMPGTGRATTGTEVVRTVYFSALDSKGVAVTDLTVADLAVKEGGKNGVIRNVEPATAPLALSLLVDDGGSGSFQPAVAQFLQTLIGHGVFAIRALNPQASKLTDFTDDTVALRTALGGIGPRGRITSIGEQIVEAVREAAADLRQRRAVRPAIVVVTVIGEQLQSAQADATLSALQNSGASLSVVHMSYLQLGHVLGDGPGRSGGMIQSVGSGVPPGPAVAKVAAHYLHQYALTYALPEGVKPNEKLSVTTNRKGVTLLAPTRIPDLSNP